MQNQQLLLGARLLKVIPLPLFWWNLEISLHFPALWAELSSPTVAISASESKESKVHEQGNNYSDGGLALADNLALLFFSTWMSEFSMLHWISLLNNVQFCYISNFFTVKMSFCSFTVYDIFSRGLTFYHVVENVSENLWNLTFYCWGADRINFAEI